MPTTSNFGWTTPADTDLVKDGAAAIRTLGNGIDTSFLDLKGGSTDQVLAKNSNTDLDFKWVAQDDSNAIQNAIVDAKADLITATAADTPARLGVGANGTVLTADSAEATGLKWAVPAVGSNFTLLNAGGTTLSGSTLTISGISNVEQLAIYIVNGSTNTTGGLIKLRFNADSGNNYRDIRNAIGIYTTYATGNFSSLANATTDDIILGYANDSASATFGAFINVFGTNSSGAKPVNFTFSASNAGKDGEYTNGGGFYLGSSAISSVSLITESGSFDAGTIYVYATA